MRGNPRCFRGCREYRNRGEMLVKQLRGEIALLFGSLANPDLRIVPIEGGERG